ncbi:MAG: SDR family NAD(P)-dependent oxidoreductase [Mahellales bacterium]|jgi:short-subunit dehydrogenase
MKASVVTGATSGIGLEIARTLLRLRYKVYGIGRDFSKVDINDTNYIKVLCDLEDIEGLTNTINGIKKSESCIHVLVNNAGVGYFGPHEQLNVRKIRAMVAVNLQAPLILTQLLLRDIKKSRGYIINISSITGKRVSTHGCAYGATKAALTHFSNSLFEETRKAGVKVVSIHPDMTKTPFYDHLDFRQGDIPECYIMPKCVAQAVETVLNQREGTVITDITLRPQRNMIIRK